MVLFWQITKVIAGETDLKDIGFRRRVGGGGGGAVQG